MALLERIEIKNNYHYEKEKFIIPVADISTCVYIL